MNSCAFFVRDWISQRCLLCGARSGTRTVCGACESGLPRLVGSLCRQCATPIPTPDGTICGACLTTPPRFDRLIAPYAYVFPVDALIRALKYGGRLVVARFLASALVPLIDEAVDLLVPMPLSDTRLRERGFNQAHEISRHVSRATGVKTETRLCRRVRNTVPQAMLPWKARAQSVRGAFVCDVDLRGARVAVLDDVVTTGATLNEVSRVLKRAGASTVTCWSAARTLKHAIRPGGAGPANLRVSSKA